MGNMNPLSIVYIRGLWVAVHQDFIVSIHFLQSQENACGDRKCACASHLSGGPALDPWCHAVPWLPVMASLDRCADCDVGLLDFCVRFFGKTKELFDLCVHHKLILENRDCPLCGKPAILDFNLKLWRCQKKSAKGKKKNIKCNFQESVFKNTFFDKARLDIETILLFVNTYVRECFSYVFVRSELKIDDGTICDRVSFCREVLIEWSLKRAGQIGGEGKIIEIDESKFGKRKYNVGRLVEGQWVFGGVCGDTRECFMVSVEHWEVSGRAVGVWWCVWGH